MKVRNQNINQATGHDISNMQFTIIDKVNKNDQTYRIEKEKFFIDKFNTFHAGINRMP